MTKEEAINLVIKNKDSFVWLDESFRANKKIALLAMKKNGAQLRYVSDNLKNDYDVVLLAVGNSVLALAEASEEMRKNRGIVKAAINHDIRSLSVAHLSFKESKELAVLALSKNPKDVKYFSQEIQDICGDSNQVNRLLKAIASENLSNSLSASLGDKSENPKKKI